MVGSDIEVFLLEPTTGKYISAVGMIGGTKEDPRKLEKDGCCVQEDNVALEYNVPPVLLNEAGASDMWGNIQYVLDTVKAEGSIPPDLEIVCCSSANFEADQLNTPKAMQFGCMPDYNAWDGGLPNMKPDGETSLRCSGGHLHLSYAGFDDAKSLQLVRIFDLFLAVPGVLVDRDRDRRRLYGKAGAYRLKQFGPNAGGFEYRVLSNWWSSKEVHVKWVFNQIQKAFDFYNAGAEGLYIYEKEIIEAINDSDPDLAYVLCVRFGIELPQIVEEYVTENTK